MKHNPLLLSMLTIGLVAPLGLAQGVDRPPGIYPKTEIPRPPDVSLIVHMQDGVVGKYFEPFDVVPHFRAVRAWNTAIFEVVAPAGSPYVFFVGAPRDDYVEIPGIRGALAVGPPLFVISVGVTAPMAVLPMDHELYCNGPDWYFASARIKYVVPARVGPACVQFQAASLWETVDGLAPGFTRPTAIHCR